MEASRAATGMFDVLATNAVRFMMPTSFPSIVVVNSGKSHKTSAISLPRSPHPTYITASLFENFEIDCEMTVLPQPKAPGTAHVPPNTDGKMASTTLRPVVRA